MRLLESIKLLSSFQQYVYAKHHLTPGSFSDSIVDISNSLCGLHSARLPTAFVMLGSRTMSCSPLDLWRNIHLKKNMIKIRCMRKTLHSISLDFAPVLHCATLELRTSYFKNFFKKNNISDSLLKEIFDNMRSFMNSTCASPREIVNFVKTKLRSRRYPSIIIENALKYLWELGEICYTNSNTQWGSETKKFAITSQYYPGLNLNTLSKEDAVCALVLKYINSFGPATLNDLIWWSGLKKTDIVLQLDRLKCNIISLKLGSLKNNFYMTTEDYESYAKFCKNSEEWAAVLAYEDSSLKGYKESRHRYIDDNNYDNLFNSIGEARASLLLNGRVVGCWVWDDKSLCIKYNFFSALPNDQVKILEGKIERMERFLGIKEKQLSLFAKKTPT